jgi:hypothetical protein
MTVVVGDFHVPCFHHFQQLHDVWSYCGIEQCHLKAVCNLVVELMYNTVIQHVSLLFTVTDYSFSVLRMNQHRTCGTLEDHWNQFSFSWLRFNFLWLNGMCTFILLFLIVWLVTLSSLISVQFRKSNHHGSIASDFWSLPNSYSFTLYTCSGAHVIKKPMC